MDHTSTQIHVLFIRHFLMKNAYPQSRDGAHISPLIYHVSYVFMQPTSRQLVP